MMNQDQTPKPPAEAPWWLPFAFLGAHYATAAILAFVGRMAVSDFLVLGSTILTAVMGVQIAVPAMKKRRTEQMDVQAEDVRIVREDPAKPERG